MKSRKRNTDKAQKLRQAVWNHLTAVMKKKNITAQQLIEVLGIDNLTRSSVFAPRSGVSQSAGHFHQ